MTDFYVATKSTVDKLAVDIAAELGIEFVELDDTVNVDAKLASDSDLIVYQMVGMEENPGDPLWVLNIMIGGKTTDDVANYDLAGLISGIRTRVHKDGQVMIRDYSGDVEPTEDEGYMYFTRVAVDPQEFDGASGIRMLNVEAAVVRTAL